MSVWMNIMSNQEISLQSPPASVAPEKAQLAIKRLALISVLAIALGFAMQGLILATKLVSGGPFPGSVFLVDLAQGVTWSFFVCSGVGIGISLSKARAALAGLISMIFAPLAVAAAKSSQKVMAGMIGAADQPAALSLATVSVMRAIQYGILGWLLATLARKGVERPLPYLASGSAVGVILGGAIAALTYHAAVTNGMTPGLPKIASSIVNEVLAPIGCAMVIYFGLMIGRNLKIVFREQ
jgi:hypothetical protein